MNALLGTDFLDNLPGYPRSVLPKTRKIRKLDIPFSYSKTKTDPKR